MKLSQCVEAKHDPERHKACPGQVKVEDDTWECDCHCHREFNVEQ